MTWGSEELATEWLVWGLITAGLAQSKNRSGFNWFVLWCLFGPFALFFLLLSEKLKEAD